MIGAHEDRPLQATMTLVEVESGHNIGPNNTLKFNVNPQITVENAEATEGTDTHLVFKLTLLPPALETTTVQYRTTAGTATGGGVDYTDINPTTMTWNAGDSIKYVRVPIINDSVDDSGKEMILQVNNASGVTRLVQREGYYSNGQYIPTEFLTVVGAIGTIYNDEPGPTDTVSDLPVVTIEADAEYETEGSSASFTGSAGLQARRLYYETEPRKLRMAFTTGVDTGELTLAAGNVKLAFPENTSGDSSFSWNNVDVDWTDGQTFEARLVRGEREAT